MSMKIGIIGAGIAGLSAAVALRRGGHECEVFEQPHCENEVGAAITITPYGGLVLKKWGLILKRQMPSKARRCVYEIMPRLEG
ncbi:hypothetical protein FKW77_007359 [Venturia effusa]|uniref:FAD-binding domain-containing protein n=1 Tax=Venturia effusa TaxID=50376 RepID=A0A517LFU2_9PEZI|nr:hypothetical protein FKW77_007359 [Venturia effusa]